MAIVYKTTNLVNGKIYVGKLVNENRSGYLGSGKILKLAIKKYGKENFVRETIETIGDDHDLLCIREKYWIAKLDAMNPEIGYNLCEGGRGVVGYRFTEDAKLKMSKARSGKNNPNYGKTHSAKTKEKMRNAKLGTVASDETRVKLSKLRLGEKNPQYGKTGKDSAAYGRKHTEEEKKKMSEVKMGEKNPMYGKKSSPETLEKISGTNNHGYGKRGDKSYSFGRKHTEEELQKMSDSHKGKVFSPEARQNISKSKLGDKNPMYGKTGNKNPFFGKTHTPETKQKMSDNHWDNSGINSPNITKKEVIVEIISLLDKGYSVSLVDKNVSAGKKVIYKVKNTRFFHNVYNL